ncbi:MAG: Asp-tRNA(Asn)/Glu-tRNA(Gln) amidotransferase subunit GatA [Clostridia bacterium]|nr:Asp-tRNA(Asn)/Glu-tRNA(Gln) amidotransferase subunit GatA [Clostridia bacterium]
MGDIVKRGVIEHAEALARGEYSAEELVRAYLARIEEKEASVDAFLYVDCERALDLARESDKRRADGVSRGRFDGIPIAVKDNICTRSMPTTCASKMLDGYIPPYDATVIERLRANGFIIIGKTNMDEFGMGSSCENSAFKITKNPFDNERVAGGSSGGSAAAVAAFEAPCALGSDTGGSVRQPSAFCGTVGMKPTYGRVSRYGLVAFASSLEQIGVITSSVADNAALLGMMAGQDAKDATTASVGAADFESDISGGVSRLRIGFPRELFGKGISREVREAVLAAAEKYGDMGAEVFEVSLPSLEYALPAYYVISSAEASSNLSRFDGVRYGYRAAEYENITELYLRSRSQGLGDEVKRRIMLGTFALSAGYYDEYYARARRAAALIKRDFERVFRECDLLLSPTTPETAFKIGEKKNSPTQMYATDICSVPANIAGIPALSLPCGVSAEGLPIGMQLMGDSFSEALLYRAAYAFERLGEAKNG